MNTMQNLIMLKGEDKTKAVTYCAYNHKTKEYDVCFGGPPVYHYSPSNVIYLKNPDIIQPQNFRILFREKELYNIEAIRIFRDSSESYWKVFFKGGGERAFKQSELEISETCLSNPHAKNVLTYLKEIAALSDIQDPNSGEILLRKRYEEIIFVGKELALAKYLEGAGLDSNRKNEFVPIFPFGCNASQYQAVKNAMENQMSIIQGPPGTGKTQTILNILANILLLGKNVQVVSNNNSAIENIYEKLASPEYQLEFIVASLGKSENKKSFIQNQTGQYPDFTNWKMKNDAEISLTSIRHKSLLLQKIFEKEERAARLKQEIAIVETEWKYFKKHFENLNLDEDCDFIKPKISSKKILQLESRYRDYLEKNKPMGLFFKIKNMIQFGITNWSFYKQESSELLTLLQNHFYKTKIRELNNELKEIQDFLATNKGNLLREMQEESMRVLKDALAKRYNGKSERMVFSEEHLWKDSKSVLNEYPVVLSTTFSSKSSLGKNVVFDYLIMDEASQVDVATGALSLSGAKNCVIVGDKKQLPNVVTTPMREASDKIYDNFKIGEGYRFSKSFLQSMSEVIPDIPQTLLREHYRCHPKIINFCNQKFYDGELVIMTEDKDEKDVLMAVKSVKGNHARGHYSQRQIDIIMHEIIPSYIADKEKLGIIAPYREQVKALKSTFDNPDISTVHKFQGREKDSIIISTVDDVISDFVDDPYLLNVAVSRAKKQLIVVISGNEQEKESNLGDLVGYIEYNNFVLLDSKVTSVFDYLYKQYKEARKKYFQLHKRRLVHDSENFLYDLIEEILKMERFQSLGVANHYLMRLLIDTSLLEGREREYTTDPRTHVDFLIHNKVTKKPVLVIEVDGYAFHKTGTQQSPRDMLKDKILEQNGIPLLRLSTVGSREKEKIIQKLNELLGCENSG
ncbi:MAG: AAA domain-containing protein [Peptostreptococcaceae bacterium]|nr:AAA domain-containing protein [Peptostreptococcaceae bacterium]